MRTQVNVSRDMHAKLKNLKASLGLASVDAIFEYLCARLEGVVEEGGVDGGDDGDGEPPVRRRRIDVREPLYSFDTQAERRGMLEYYTGFDRRAIELLIRRMGEVRTT